MPICHVHNLINPHPTNKRFGLRVRVRTTDPFSKLVGKDWHKEHWFGSREERDDALAKITQRYVYYRPGDQPTLDYELLEQS